jgi:hypothetical protein
MDSIKDLVRVNEANLPDNFVAVATQISPRDRVPYHAAIIIRHESKDHLYHFPGFSEPRIETDFDSSSWYVYKIIEAINTDDESEVGSVLQQCFRICENSQAVYGYIFDGSTYDHEGRYYSKSGLPEIATCVGFCVNTLSSTLIDVDSYLELNDWTNNTMEPTPTYAAIAERLASGIPNLDRVLYESYKKRITPLEYISSGFINIYPIRKNRIAAEEDQVLMKIRGKFPE